MKRQEISQMHGPKMLFERKKKQKLENKKLGLNLCRHNITLFTINLSRLQTHSHTHKQQRLVKENRISNKKKSKK